MNDSITKYPYVSVWGTPNILIFFRQLSISEQTIDRALTIHTSVIKLITTKKNNLFDFHHIPKLSIGFKGSESIVQISQIY